MSIDQGVLYVVATPIGNLADITARAEKILSEVDLILAEDKRRTGILLKHLGIRRPMLALHEHNERELLEQLAGRLSAGETMALVSDAGTPLISDPGFPLVNYLRQIDIPVVPIPGASALTAALSVAGMPTDRFVFEGFLPRSGQSRKTRLKWVAQASCTSVIYESVHRIDQTLRDLLETCGASRQVTLLRELTKLHETILCGSLAELSERVALDKDQHKGELVLVLAGKPAEIDGAVMTDAHALLAILVDELPVKQASSLVAKYTGLNRKQLYQVAQRMRDEKLE